MITKKEIAKVVALKKSAIRIRNGDEVIRGFVEPLTCNKILEIGTYKGVTSLFMSQFCNKLYTIDLLHGKLEKETVVGLVRHKLWKRFGVDNIEYLPAMCDNSKARIIEKLDFDFCFIDGGHTYEDVEFDFERVKHCGRVLFHDYDDSGIEKRNGVWNFVNTLPKEQITVRDIFAYWEG